MRLTVNKLTKSFKNKEALKHVTFELTEGVYGLLGANGSGKTTLMRIIASIVKPSSGTIYFDGIDTLTLDENYREILGYMPQHLGFYKNFTAEKFLLYIAALKGIEQDAAKDTVMEMLELVNLTDKRKDKIKTFSGGMQRRLGIAQGLLNDPKVLIVDEPTAGLDPKERIRFRNLLSKISKNRIVLLSTHIVTDIEYIAKEIMILKEGELLHKKDPETLLQFLSGKVWLLDVKREEVDAYQEKYKIGNIVSKGDFVQLRIISEMKVHEEAVSAEPNLEDIYLYYFDEVEVHETVT
ncbi:ABC transporter ATP-binding protein [Virgibacillus sp. NKC19-3]|uniref:ABC transporter ATP-binding protein n=1 Tax=Virgibacillus saliphilus TaxID=2831674 RepID=UPI001C9A5A46|nr:ABC transporter ATP-binding protein [Virgibacillus sp. NKC19-3]MBY7142648.1 ABC transporter ATP-binding protein [Virgibacillus sp. NKC19-3]